MTGSNGKPSRLICRRCDPQVGNYHEEREGHEENKGTACCFFLLSFVPFVFFVVQNPAQRLSEFNRVGIGIWVRQRTGVWASLCPAKLDQRCETDDD
jgi:hypothetical protein